MNHTDPQYEEYESLIRRVVEELSINKDHARERVDHLLNIGRILIYYKPNRNDPSSVQHYLRTGDQNHLK